MEFTNVTSPKFGALLMDANKYSETSKTNAITLFQDARAVLGTLPHGHLKGIKYNSDTHTLWVLESGATEEEFKSNPLLMAIGALLGSARSDWWYTYEKKWDCDYCYEDETDDYYVEE